MLKNAILNTQNYTTTENGALTLASTRSAVLDLFALAGAVDNRGNMNVNNLIANALDEDFKLAVKVVFYLSDIRQGQGRRDLFRAGLMAIVRKDLDFARKLLTFIPEFGRYDYLYWFMDTPLRLIALDVLGLAVAEAIDEQKPSLVFKWLASEDASSDETIRNARITRKHFGLTSREYRKLLSKGRAALGDALVERKMCAGEWDKIDYPNVPSVAMKRYRKAFIKRNKDGFSNFITKVSTGEAKINASVLYPKDIISAGLTGMNGTLERQTLIEQWKALPNYITDGVRAIAVVDTSGSMHGEPLLIAGSLGIYTAERLTGEFKNAYISFSSVAKLHTLPNGNIFDKFGYFLRNSIVENTNLQSVFELILKSALTHNIPASELPNRVIIISDMEFDSATSEGYGRNSRTTNLDAIKAKYIQAGYEVPQLIFWNVAARNAQVAAGMNEQGVVLASGYSPVLLKTILSNKPTVSPYEAMLNTIDTERYSFIDTL